MPRRTAARGRLGHAGATSLVASSTTADAEAELDWAEIRFRGELECAHFGFLASSSQPYTPSNRPHYPQRDFRMRFAPAQRPTAEISAIGDGRSASGYAATHA